MSNPGYPKPGEELPYSPQGPPPPYGPNPPPQVTAVVAPSPAIVVVNGPLLGPGPSTLQCQSCHAMVQTRVQHETTTKTHLMALLLCLIGCWPCAVIPYCTDSCQSTNHYCPNCGAYLGAYNN